MSTHDQKKIEKSIKDSLPVIDCNENDMVLLGCIRSIYFSAINDLEIFMDRNGLSGEVFCFLVISKPSKNKGFVVVENNRIGVVCSIQKDVDSRYVLFSGLYRAKIININTEYGSDKRHTLAARVEPIQDIPDHKNYCNQRRAYKNEASQIARILWGIAHIKNGDDMPRSERSKAIILVSYAEDLAEVDFSNVFDIDAMTWSILHTMSDLTTYEYKQRFLNSLDPFDRVQRCRFFLDSVWNALKKDPNAFRKKDEKLKEDKKSVVVSGISIDDQSSNISEDIKKRWRKFTEIKKYMNDDARKVVVDDVKKLVTIGSSESRSAEWSMYMGRLDFNLGCPWGVITQQERDISKVESILEADHAHLDDVKDKVCDFVAPEVLEPGGKGSILCFIGPPGVGKTSLAKSIARATNRKFVRISIGGVREESEIRGHRITFVGSKAGQVMELIRRCGSKNPVFLIDEIDKIGYSTLRGDVSSALLEVLDSEQNHAFKDHYLEAPFDLSQVLFICTGNSEYEIHNALRDRMHVINLPGYLEYEKVDIARRFIIPKGLREARLITKNKEALVDISWGDNTVLSMIRQYTREAGVRNLERVIGTVVRKVVRKYLHDKIDKFHVESDKLTDLLGPAKYRKKPARKTEVGEAIGLVWTAVGGDIIFVQAELYPNISGDKTLSQTGQLGEILRESDKVAMTLIRNKLARKKYVLDKLKENSIHLHIPDGAVPKDGPSAGITTSVALYSELTNQRVKDFLAMTGEINVKEHIMPVGGIKEKMVAAYNAGLMEVMLPKDNENDLHEIPELIKKKLKFHLVSTIDEALKIAFPDDSA